MVIMISKNVKIFTFISLLFIILLVLGGVSAQSTDETQEDINADTTISTDSNIIEQDNEMNVQKQVNNKNTKEATTVSTYDELKNKINGATDEWTEIELENKTYTINEPITWGTRSDGQSRTFVIRGNGAIIDGSNTYQFITVNENYRLDLLNLTIQHTKADKGAAVINYGELNAHNVTFQENTAAYDGGAIYSTGRVIVSGNTVFYKNMITNGVNGNGGAAIFTTGELNIADSVFSRNNATYTAEASASNGANGGAIFVSNSISDLIIQNTSFWYNDGRHGGAILIDDNLGRNEGIKRITGCEFVFNSALYGGAIEVYNDLLIEDSYFSDNEVWGYGSSNINPKGGAICVNDLVSSGTPGKLTVRNTTFEENKAPTATYGGLTLVGYGGAIYNSGPDAVIDNCTFLKNEANKGGAYYLFVGTQNRTLTRSTTVTNSIFRENRENAANAGSAIHDEHAGGAHNSVLTIDNCLFEDNHQDSNGGYAIYAIYDNITISNTNINDNVRPINVGTSRYPKFINNVSVSGLKNVTNIYGTFPEVHPTNYEELVIVSNRINNEYKGTLNVRIHLTGTEYIETEPIIFDNITAPVNIFGNYHTIDANGQQFLTVGEGKTVSINNITIANAKAEKGAAIVNHGTLTTQNNVLFENNEALYYGGAIYSTGNLTVKSTNFTNNKVTTIKRAGSRDYGGAAIASLGKLTVEKSNFVENVAAHNDTGAGGDGGCGGAINVLNTTQAVSITTSNFTKNGARHGGAILINNNDKTNTNKVTINKNNFNENTALYGGAIDTYQQVNITNNNFTRNTVKGEGSGARPAMGGAIVLNKGNSPYTAIIENNTFKENEAQDTGRSGVIEVQQDTTLTSKNNVYQDNKAFDSGVVNNFGSATFTNDTFTGNTAKYTGVFSQQGETLTIDACKFENNEAEDFGDILFASADATITASIINTDNLEKLIYNDYAEITTTQNIVNGELLEQGLIKTTLSFNSDVDIVLDENNVLKATLIDATDIPVSGKAVNLVVDGSVVGSVLTDENGVASFNYKPTEGTNGTFKFTFTPDDYYIASESEEKTVQYKIKTKLTITELVPLLGGENSYTVKGELRDANDNLLPSMPIYLEVDGLPVGTGQTGNEEESLGQFAISFTQENYDPSIGEHTVHVSFPGTDIYNKNLTAENKTFIVYGNTQINVEKDTYVTIKDYETAEDQIVNIEINDESEGGADLTLYVNGYDVTRYVAPGKDSLNISLKEILSDFAITNTSTVTIEYKPYDENYKTSDDTFTIIIKQTPTIKYDVINDVESKVAIEFTATDENNNDIEYLSLTLSGDVTDTARIGRVYKNSSLTEGTYTVTVTSGETEEYGPATLEFTFDVKKDPQTIIDELNESLINNQTALEGNITALEQLQAENEALKAQIENLTEALEANKTALEGNITALEEANEKIAQLEQNITTLTEALEANQTALAGNITALEEANEKIAQLEQNITTLTEALEANQTALQEAQETITELNNNITALEDELNETQSALAEAQDTITELNNNITALQEELAETQSALAESQEENANLTAKVAELEAALAANQTALQEAQETIDQLNNNITALESELNDTNAALAEAQETITELENNITTLENELNETLNELADTQEELDEANESIEDLNNIIDALEVELNDTQNELAETQEALDDANEAIEELEYRVSELELALDMAEKALDKAIETIANLTKPKTTSISIDPISNAKYGDEITITGLLVNEDGLSLANQPVTITFNGEDTEVTTRNGEFKFVAKITTVGENTVTVNYTGNDKYEASEASTTFISEKADIIITFDEMEAIKKGETLTISGTVTDHNNNTMANSVVKLLINNGRKTLRADDEGKFTFDYALSKVGENNITATFLENDFYNEAVEKVSVEVLPLGSIIEIDPIDSVVKGESVTITGKLTDENGNAIANAQVRVFVNGSPKTVKTDENGLFTHTYIMGRVGDNIITVRYEGSINYLSSESSTIVVVDKTKTSITLDSFDKIVIGDYVTIKGRITDIEGNVIPNVQVKITVNDSPKTLKCDENGEFTHQYKIIKTGEYIFTVYFSENNYYFGSNATRIVELLDQS